eukprot:scaffold2.g6933.t1
MQSAWRALRIPLPGAHLHATNNPSHLMLVRRGYRRSIARCSGEPLQTNTMPATADADQGIHAALAESQDTEESTVVFQNQWQAYAHAVDVNLLYHREMYDAFHGWLAAHPLPPGAAVLDLGCGDAIQPACVLRRLAAEGALAGLGSYTGVDVSQAALDGAAAALAFLQPAAADFVETSPAAAYDLALSSFSLHHLSAVGKAAFMAAVARALRPGGAWVLVDVYLPDWEKALIVGHATAYDLPEKVSAYRALAAAAGFAAARVLDLRGDLCAALALVNQSVPSTPPLDCLLARLLLALWAALFAKQRSRWALPVSAQAAAAASAAALAGLPLLARLVGLDCSVRTSASFLLATRLAHCLWLVTAGSNDVLSSLSGASLPLFLVKAMFASKALPLAVAALSCQLPLDQHLPLHAAMLAATLWSNAGVCREAFGGPGHGAAAAHVARLLAPLRWLGRPAALLAAAPGQELVPLPEGVPAQCWLLFAMLAAVFGFALPTALLARRQRAAARAAAAAAAADGKPAPPPAPPAPSKARELPGPDGRAFISLAALSGAWLIASAAAHLVA